MSLKHLFSIVLLAALSSICSAQNTFTLPSPRELLLDDLSRAANINSRYEALDTTVTPAPEGYKLVFSSRILREKSEKTISTAKIRGEKEEVLASWEAENTKIFSYWCISKENKGEFAGARINILKDILSEVKEALAGGSSKQKQRILPVRDFQALLSLIGASGNDYNGSEKDCCDHYAAFLSICQGANFEFEFYRNQKGGVIVKMLHNEREIGIPTIPPRDRVYYDWPVLEDYLTYRINGGYKAPPLTASVIRQKILDNDDTGLEVIGTLAPPKVGAEFNPFWSIDCCTLDRNYADFNQYQPYLAELGAGYARIQSGWEKCEQSKGVYSFEWLDEIVDGIIEAGLTPWICLCYGNYLYEQSGKKLGSEIFTDEVTMLAWEKYVEAIVKRYKGKISMYEVWNEPSFGGTMRRAIPYANLFSRTAPIIRKYDSNAKIAGISLGAEMGTEFPKVVFDKLKQDGTLAYMDYLTFHPYGLHPESRKDDIQELRNFVDDYAPGIKMLEGEVGSVSDLYIRDQQEGSEYIQAKWVLRQMAFQYGLGYPTSIFSMIDNLYPDRLQSYGMIRADVAKKAVYKRPSFYAFSSMAAVLHDGFYSDGDIPFSTNSKKDISCVSILHDGNKVGAMLWFSGEKPTNDMSKDRIKIRIKNIRIEDPVYVDPITGRIYKLKRFKNTGNGFVLKSLPVWDSPVIVIDKSSLRIAK